MKLFTIAMLEQSSSALIKCRASIVFIKMFQKLKDLGRETQLEFSLGNKNTHKIIILGIYIFGSLSLILLKCLKSRFG